MAGFQPSTYWDSKYRQGPALIRARRPYLVRNIVTGITLACTTLAIYIYTIKAVGQEEFKDVKVPEKPRELRQQEKQ